MAIRPDGKIEMLSQMTNQLIEDIERAISGFACALLRPSGQSVPASWPVFTEGERVAIKDRTFTVKAIGDSYLLLEPVSLEIGNGR